MLTTKPLRDLRQAPPPPPPTDAELRAVGLELDRPSNPVCDSSAKSQCTENHNWNKQQFEGYLNAIHNAETQASNPPPTIEPPSLDGDYDPNKPYYRLEDERALKIFCSQDPQRPVPYPPDTWNWSKVF